MLRRGALQYFFWGEMVDSQLGKLSRYSLVVISIYDVSPLLLACISSSN